MLLRRDSPTEKVPMNFAVPNTINIYDIEFHKMLGYNFTETDMKLDLSFNNINDLFNRTYEFPLQLLQNITLNKTVFNMSNSIVSAYFKLSNVENLTLNYTNKYLLTPSTSENSSSDKTEAVLHLNGVGFKVNFEYMISLFGFGKTVHQGYLELRNMDLPINVMLDKATSNGQYNLQASPQSATLDELFIDFGETSPIWPLQTIYHLLYPNKQDQQNLLNFLLDQFKPTIENMAINYNIPLSLTKFGITGVVGFTQPVQFVQKNSEWALSVQGAVDMSAGSNKPAQYYKPTMPALSSGSKKSNFYLSADLINAVLWAVYTSKLANITISQKTLDKFNIKLVTLTTKDLKIILPGLALHYPGEKNVYINVTLQDYDINTTRVQMRQGRLAFVARAHVTMYVD